MWIRFSCEFFERGHVQVCLSVTSKNKREYDDFVSNNHVRDKCIFIPHFFSVASFVYIALLSASSKYRASVRGMSQHRVPRAIVLRTKKLFKEFVCDAEPSAVPSWSHRKPYVRRTKLVRVTDHANVRNCSEK